ncbi:hypothetical protein Q2941_37065 [Bradyrhizobium sp. UFLA05-153]
MLSVKAPIETKPRENLPTRLAASASLSLRSLDGEAARFVMLNEALLDELRQLERDTVEGERRLAEQEALVISLKQQKQDASSAQAELEGLRENQRRRQQDRHRLLSLLQP